MKHLIFIFLSIIIFGLTAQAAEKPVPEIIVNNGIAFSWQEEDNAPVVAYDVVSAWKHREPAVADCGKYSTMFKGAKWCFANATDETAFIKAIDKDGDNKYVPFVGGRCALGTSWGRLGAKGDPRTGRIIDSDLGPVLVLQSAQKWWPTFERHLFTRMEIARMRFDFGKRVGDIVPNASKEASANK